MGLAATRQLSRFVMSVGTRLGMSLYGLARTSSVCIRTFERAFLLGQTLASVCPAYLARLLLNNSDVFVRPLFGAYFGRQLLSSTTACVRILGCVL